MKLILIVAFLSFQLYGYQVNLELQQNPEIEEPISPINFENNAFGSAAIGSIWSEDRNLFCMVIFVNQSVAVSSKRCSKALRFV